MNYFSISATVNAITSLFVALFILLNNPKSPKNRSFAYFAFFIAIWSTFYSIWPIETTKEYALLYMRISIGLAAFIPTAFFHFTFHLINEYQEHRRSIYLLYLYSFIIAATSATDLYIKDTMPLMMFLYSPLAGITFNFHTLNYLITPPYCLTLIYKEIKRSNPQRSSQFKAIFWGVLIAYIGGSTSFLQLYAIPFPPIGNIFVCFYTIFIAYAAFRYQLMDIKIILKRGLIYTILITLITLVYFLSIYLIEHIFQEMFGYKSLLISMVLTTIIALAIIPLRNIIQKFIENYLFKGSFLEIAEQNDLLREEVIQTEKLKSIAILASGMAHEIKNPLTVLKTFSEYLPKKLDDKEFLKKFGPIISQEVNRIDNLVHELLDFAKPADPVLKPTRIQDVLNNTLEFLNNEFIKHNIKLQQNSYLATNLTLALDSNQIKQALLNIFLNAIEAMPNGGQLNITTSLSLERNKVHIKIQDTGTGIDPQDLTHIFDPFFSKKDNGTGLGLSITHEIIKKHGGKILVESIKGKGSVFILELPVNY